MFRWRKVMNKALLIVAVATLIVGAAFTGLAMRKSGDRPDRAALTANQIVAETDARTARIKANLRLTPEQENNWPGLEGACATSARTVLIVRSPSEPNVRSRRTPTMSSRIYKATRSFSASAPPM